MNRPIVLSEYDASWPARFAVEAAAIREALGVRAFRIEHAGSTSVPGLVAKPIIDIVLVVADSSDEASYRPGLEAAGYAFRFREPEWHEHRLFDGPRSPINLHVFSALCPEIDRMLAFRDWLRHNPADRELYAAAKRRLAARTWPTIDDYADAKSGVVAGILARASTPTDVALVKALLHEQHGDVSELPLGHRMGGWDNDVFRLGDRLAVRLPRRATTTALLEHEQRWLPLLAPELPLRIPAPVRVGRPSPRFPRPWSIVPWFSGASALTADVADRSTMADALGHFVCALHQPAPADAPMNPWRGVPLASRTELLHRDVRRLGDTVDQRAIFRTWDRVLAAGAWRGPDVWIHGDLHPGNLVIDDGRIVAVVDFGDLTSGDPATDLAVAWMLFSTSDRARFRAAARSPSAPLDDDTWTRARGWALALAAAYMANAPAGEPLIALGRATIARALSE